ncbi:MAG: hypothetical protein GY782_06020 [Gammaproteobacteria bacterium]|nr:hypothetical protein [Gammaproteobacteria bacterium]
MKQMDRKDLNEPLMTEEEYLDRMESLKKEQPTVSEVIEEIKRVLKGSGFRIEEATVHYGDIIEGLKLDIKRIKRVI